MTAVQEQETAAAQEPMTAAAQAWRQQGQATGDHKDRQQRTRQDWLQLRGAGTASLWGTGRWRPGEFPPMETAGQPV